MTVGIDLESAATPAGHGEVSSFPTKGHRFVFVGGLHRSGTTLLADLLAAHPHVSGLRGTSKPRDEGMHLQDVYPAARAHGGPGRFAFAAGAHLTETDAVDADYIRRRLLEAWSPYWDLSRPLLLEKSPPNMIMTRFLRAAFPEASFVLIMRHPLAVAGATQKWSHTSYDSLVRHWLVAYETMYADIADNESAILVRYEELALDPITTLAQVYKGLGLPVGDAEGILARMGVLGGINDSYFTRWRGRWPLWMPLYRRVIQWRYGTRVRQLSYDLRDPTILAPLPRSV